MSGCRGVGLRDAPEVQGASEDPALSRCMAPRGSGDDGRYPALVPGQHPHLVVSLGVVNPHRADLLPHPDVRAHQKHGPNQVVHLGRDAVEHSRHLAAQEGGERVSLGAEEKGLSPTTQVAQAEDPGGGNNQTTPSPEERSGAGSRGPEEGT